MKITIHRGAQQIGGTCTEIRSEKARIIIDIGAELPSSQKRKKHLLIQGVTKDETENSPKCDGIFITHYHGDHIGEVQNALPGIPIYMGKAAKAAYCALQERLAVIPGKETLKMFLERFKDDKNELLETGRFISIKDKDGNLTGMKVMPILTDHSAFDAYMFLIEYENKRILHTGDFRTHGLKGKEVFDLLEKHAKGIDVLIIEGTMLSRPTENITTEDELHKKAEGFFENNKRVFVLCSSMNIDTIAGFYNSARKHGMVFVVDEYQKDILDIVTAHVKESEHLYAENQKIYDFSNCEVYKKESCFSCKDNEKYCIKCREKLKPNRNHNEDLRKRMETNGFCMLVRANNHSENHSKKRSISEKMIEYFQGHQLIYSIWDGYLKVGMPWFNQNYSDFLEFSRKNGGTIRGIDEGDKGWHTSGHATAETIKNVIRITSPGVIIPIHGEDSHNYDKLGVPKGLIVHMRDGQTYDIETG